MFFRGRTFSSQPGTAEPATGWRRLRRQWQRRLLLEQLEDRRLLAFGTGPFAPVGYAGANYSWFVDPPLDTVAANQEVAAPITGLSQEFSVNGGDAPGMSGTVQPLSYGSGLSEPADDDTEYTHSTQIGDGVHGEKDVDIYRFDAVAGSTVLLTTSLPSGGDSMNTAVRLFDASGAQLAVNDDFGGSDYSHIEHTFATAGTYYAGVSGYPNFDYDPNVAGSGAAGSTGDYLLTSQLDEPAALGEIRGFKWHDLNSNGVWDTGEPALAGWEIYLDLNNNGQWDAGEPKTVTAADGSYVFADLPAGTYIVGEVFQDGWQQTYPGNWPDDGDSSEWPFPSDGEGAASPARGEAGLLPLFLDGDPRNFGYDENIIYRLGAAWDTSETTLQSAGVDILHILVDFSDMVGSPITDEQAEATMLEAGEFMREASWGKLWFENVVVTPTLRMPQTTAWYAEHGRYGQTRLLLDAHDAAWNAGYRSRDFWSYSVTFDRIEEIWWAGLGWIGMPGILLNGYGDSPAVAAHEFGHNLGAQHSGFWSVSDGNPLSPDGQFVEYGDAFDIMGKSRGLFPDNHFNACWMTQFGWMSSSSNVIHDPADGVYRLFALDAGAGTYVEDRTYALRVPTGGNADYWIEYRQAPYDNIDQAGLQIRWSPGSPASRIHTALLDMSGGGDSFQAPLPISETFSDMASGVTVTAVHSGVGADGNWWVDVRIGEKEIPPGSHMVTVASGQIIQDVNFGNRQLSLDTTTEVVSNANPAVYGDEVFFTATVSSDGGPATGTVQFFVSGTPLGTPVALSGGTGQSIAVTKLNAGTHTVVAQYQPDGGFNASSGLLDAGQQITQRPITVTAVADAKVYDGTPDSDKVPLITSGSLVGGDTAAWFQTFDSRHIGTEKTLTPDGTVNDGNDGNNYVVAFQTAATGSITQAQLAITGITAAHKMYDGTTDATLDVSDAELVGVLPNDTVALNASNATGAFQDSDVGKDKMVTVTGLMLEGSDANNYSLTQPTTTANITAVVLIGPAELALPEGDQGLTAFEFTVTLSAPVSSPVTVRVDTVDGTATVGDGDYQPLVDRVLTFLPGQPLQQTVTVYVIGDTRPKLDETFFVELSGVLWDDSPDGRVSLGEHRAKGVILNDDPWLTGLAASPDPVIYPGLITLKAFAAPGADGLLTEVAFYWGEEYLGSVQDGGNDWSLIVATSGWPLGRHTFSATARNQAGTWSDPVDTMAAVYHQHPPLSFGAVPILATKERRFKVHNDGEGTVTIDANGWSELFTIRPENGVSGQQAWQVAPGTTREYVIAFAPVEAGEVDVYLTLVRDDSTGAASRISGLGVAGWRNPLNPYDVNGDGFVTPQDVLLLINEINRGVGVGELPPRTAEEPGPPFFLDVLGNGHLSPNDVLQVINYINRGGTEEEPSSEAAEGEPAGDHGSSSDHGWLAMVNAAVPPAMVSMPSLPLAAGWPNDLRVGWLASAKDDLVYRTTQRQPDLPLKLASWEPPDADIWQPDDSELPDWETLLDDPDTDPADLDAYFAALG